MSTHPNPQDSMKSTWLRGSRSQWRWSHRLLATQLARHPELEEDIPVHAPTSPMPYLAGWTPHAFVLLTALGTMAAHQALLLWATPPGRRALSAWLVFGLYTASSLSMLGRLTTALRRLGKAHGFLDGAHARDGVPDVGVDRVAASLGKLMLGRPGLTVLLAYSSSGTSSPMEAVSRPEWWAWLLLVDVGAYTLALDFFFYWYHRAMHDVPALWRLHRRHHLTKHPSALLTGYADDAQELGDIAVMPVLAFLALRAVLGPGRFDFYHWWVCQVYVMFTESVGHCGVRMLASPPSTWGWLWDRLGVSLAIEDHDMHHRRGSRKSFNYGKQTLVWDHVFGTVYPREESHNVDWTRPVYFPLF